MDYLKSRVTIYEVAKTAGVSLATVSRVINNQDNVTPETRKKVEATIAKLGYKPSGLAQALATNRTTNIGVVIPSANYVYIANMLNGISTVAKEKGYLLTLFTTSHSQEDASTMVEKVITQHVDGAIIFDDILQESDVSKINSYSVPTIVINSNLVGDRVGSIAFSYTDEFIRTLDQYYERMGSDAPTPVFIHVHNCGKLLHNLEKTFINYHKEKNLPYKIFNVDDSYTRTYSDFLDYFNSEKHQKGLFLAHRDSIAAAVINAATDRGLNVPNDIEVVSFIGTKYANIIRPSVSSMNIDMQEVGRRAMYMLIDLAKQELNEKTYTLECKFVKRNSTK